ncbi:hypothetical protein BJF93_13410 [Xaviernesmea oryzae]|uniref:diguanylate cyclase n=1 Tax=Xaviernesmea oryzae TaxID=464029 RepID=A0A1Q9AQY0_9HYPH|nr:diguanylate cyclase [Xaviernesmea oryzae]OLP57843.1 hypothetical protein BJF93_13410 [Xaviernesmea oryzae]
MAPRLIWTILAGYFVVAVLLTGVQLVYEYRMVTQKLAEDVGNLGRTFSPGLTDALWRFNTDALKGILAGMEQITIVTGVEVKDDRDLRMGAVGRIAGETGESWNVGRDGTLSPSTNPWFGAPFSRRFPLVYVDENGGRHPVGSFTVYSDRALIVDHLKRTVAIILVNSLVKILILGVMFAYVIRRMVGRPLAQIDAFVRDIDADKLAGKPLVLTAGGQTELHALAATLNKTVERLRGAFAENDVLIESMREMNSTLLTKVSERTQELKRLAETDLLTGLANRRRLDEALDREIAKARREGTALSVILGDIDHFKAINDRHGHKLGDAVLVAFAEILRQDLRPRDTLGRWGGEEFMLICPATELEAARDIAETIRLRIAQTPLPVVGCRTCSFGTAMLAPQESADELVGRADAALYRSKHLGRNRVAISA